METVKAIIQIPLRRCMCLGMESAGKLKLKIYDTYDHDENGL